MFDPTTNSLKITETTGRNEIRKMKDSRLDLFRDVRDRDLKRDDGVFLGEGPLTVDKMLEHEGLVVSILVAERWQKRYLEYEDRGVEIIVASEALMSQTMGFKFHRGVIAAGRRSLFESKNVKSVLPAENRAATLLIIDGVNNVDNVGLLFRNAAAFGADGVLLSRDCCDPLYRKSLRVSLGHVLTTPFATTEDLPNAMRDAQEAGFICLGAALGNDAVSIHQAEQPERVAIVVGQERHGIRDSVLEACDTRVKIPMAPDVDSLNVAAASAVLLHHFSRGERA